MAAQRIAARPPSALSGSVGINAISPRRRGRRSRFSAQAPICSFASPLTRGRLCGHPPAAALAGLIPAHAGSTSPSWTTSTRKRAHPRSRGVDHRVGHAAAVVGGSSPLTRGRRRPSAVWSLVGRLIPAHAGSTQKWASRRLAGPAHPRSRGVDDINEAATKIAHRLIPAHAGSTGQGAGQVVQDGAHPRSRGVDDCPPLDIPQVKGSSPLTRGRLSANWYGSAC